MSVSTDTSQDDYQPLLDALGSKKPFDVQFPHGISVEELKKTVRYFLNTHKGNISDSLKVITYLIVEEWPDSDFSELSILSGSDPIQLETCPVTIDAGSIVFQCRTCQEHFSSIICFECFHNGDHEGHDYSMIRANGGFCDCGNSELWKRSGFCCNHVGNLDETHTVEYKMSLEEQDRLRCVVELVSDTILKNCKEYSNKNEWPAEDTSDEPSDSSASIPHSLSVSIPSTTELIIWLKLVLSVGQDLRRFVGSILSYPIKESWLHFMLQLDGVGKLPFVVHKSLHLLYTELIIDVYIKRSFVTSYISNYERYVMALVQHSERDGSYENDIMAAFSGHILSSPKCIPDLIGKNGLMEIQIRLLLAILEAACLPVLPTKSFDRKKSKYAHEMSLSPEFRSYIPDDSLLPHGQVPIGLDELLVEGDGEFDFASLEERIREWHVIGHLSLQTNSLLRALVISGKFRELNDFQTESFKIVSENEHNEEEPGRGIFALLGLLTQGRPIRKYFTKILKNIKKSSQLAAEGTGNIAHVLRLDWHHGYCIDTIFWRVFNELRYTMSYSRAAMHIVYERPDLFRLFVRILSMLQGMNTNTRRFDNHVESQSEKWSKCLNMEMSKHELVHFMCTNALSIDPQNAPSSDPNGLGQISGKEARLQCIAIVRQCLNEWLDREERIEMMSVYPEEKYNVAHGVSIHLPLHRLFATLIHHAVRIDGLSPQNSLGITPKEASAIMRHPLRIRSFFAQVRSDMWKKNGDPVRFQMEFYASSDCAKWMVDLDTFLLQTATIVAAPKVLIRNTLAAFQINVNDFGAFLKLEDLLGEVRMGKYLQGTRAMASAAEIPVAKTEFQSLNEEISGNTLDPNTLTWKETSLGKDAFFGTWKSNLACGKYVPIFVKEILTLFINIVTERSRCGFDDALYIRQNILHALVSENQSYSELLQASNKRIMMPDAKYVASTPIIDYHEAEYQVENHVEAILREIASFDQREENGERKYRLKHNAWEKYNRFSTSLSARSRVSAEERYYAACSAANMKYHPFPRGNITSLPLFSQYQDMDNLALALCSNLPESLTTHALRNCLDSESSTDSKYSYLVPALYLTCLSAEMAANKTNMSGIQREKIFWLSEQISEPPEEGFAYACFGALQDFIPFLRGIDYDNKPKHVEKSCIQMVTDMYLNSNRNDSDLKSGLERILLEVYSFMDDEFKEELSQKLPKMFGSSMSVDMLESADDEEERKRKAHRKKMQQKAMQQIQESQMRFEMNFEFETDSDDTSPGASSHLLVDQKEISYFSHETCALCQRHETESGEKVGLIGFCQKTKLATKDPATSKETPNQSNPEKDRAEETDLENKIENKDGSVLVPEENGTQEGEMRGDEDSSENSPADNTAGNNLEGPEKFMGWEEIRTKSYEEDGIHLNFCNHTVHAACLENYFGSILMREHSQEPFEGHDKVIAMNGEFLCPVCRRFANFLLPISKLKVKAPIWVERGDRSEAQKQELQENWTQNNDKIYLDEKVISEHTKELGKEMDLIKQGQKPSTSSQPASKLGFHARFKIFQFGKWVKWNENDDHQARSLEFPEEVAPTLQMGSVNVLTSSLLTTIVSNEISSRTNPWPGNESVRRDLGMLIREIQNNAQDFPEMSWFYRKKLWLLLRGRKDDDVTEINALATFVLSILLWDGSPEFNDIHFCLKMSAELAFEQSRRNEQLDENCWEKVLIFLRRAAIFLSCYLEMEIPLKTYKNENNDAHEEITNLLQALLLNGSNLHSEHLKFKDEKMELPRVKLISLPKTFEDLIREVYHRKCDDCGGSQKNSVLCLVCGDILCQAGVIRKHAVECGEGVGLFLTLNEITVVALRDFRLSELGSLYLDTYGEEDPELRRKRPLYFSQERYENLEKLWLAHELDYDFRVLNATRFQNFRVAP